MTNQIRMVECPKRDSIWSAAALMGILILLAGIGVRWWGIGEKSYWYDEFWSLESSAGHGQEHYDVPKQVILPAPPDLLSLRAGKPIWRIWVSMGQDLHPPLYFILLRCWRDVFGSSEAATRSLSALAGIIGVFCIYDIGRLAHGRAAGLWAAALMALAGPQVELARDARGYTLVVLLGLCLVDAIIRIELGGATQRRLLAVATASLAMMLTHYVGIPVAFALGCYVLIRLPTQARKQTAGVMMAAALVFAVVWGPFLWQQRTTAQEVRAGFLMEGKWSGMYAIKQLAALPVELLGPPTNMSAGSLWISGIIYIVPLLLIRRNRFLLLWLFWLLGAAGLFALLDQVKHTHHLSYIRYVLMCGPPIYLIFAGVLAKDRGWLRHLVPAAAVLFCLLSLQASYEQWRWPDWRAIAATIDRMKEPNDLLVFSSDGKHDWFSGEYMSYAWYTKKKPKDVVMLAEPADKQLLRQMSQFSGAVIVNGTDRSPTVSLPGYRVVSAAAFLQFVTVDRMRLEKENNTLHR